MHLRLRLRGAREERGKSERERGTKGMVQTDPCGDDAVSSCRRTRASRTRTRKPSKASSSRPCCELRLPALARPLAHPPTAPRRPSRCAQTVHLVDPPPLLDPYCRQERSTSERQERRGRATRARARARERRDARASASPRGSGTRRRSTPCRSGRCPCRPRGSRGRRT